MGRREGIDAARRREVPALAARGARRRSRAEQPPLPRRDDQELGLVPARATCWRWSARRPTCSGPGATQALEFMGDFAARAHAEIYGDLLRGSGSNSRVFALWSTQLDAGEMRRIREGPGRARVELQDFASPSRELCLLIGGYIRGTLRAERRRRHRGREARLHDARRPRLHLARELEARGGRG